MLQDALTKTIPIWAAVLNRALQSYRSKHAALHKACSFLYTIHHNETKHELRYLILAWSSAHFKFLDQVSMALGQEGTSYSHQTWDADLHLPPWVSGTEQAQIECHLQEWSGALLEVSPAFL